LYLRVLVLALLLLLPGLSSSCANVAFNRAYQEVIEREVDDYRHQGSAEDLRRDAEAYLANAGFVTARSEAAVVETEWRAAGEGTRQRVRIELAPLPDGMSARAYMVWEDLSTQEFAAHSLERRADFERELHERLVSDASKRGEPAGFVYEGSAQDIWAEVTRLAFDLPEALTFVDPSPPIDSVAVSGWSIAEEQGERSRLEVRLHRHASNSYSVEVHERVERAIGERKWQTRADQRDRNLELELIRHRDPQRGQQIETQAKEAGDAAFYEAVDRGAFACQCG
jgi:hypothetical protein